LSGNRTESESRARLSRGPDGAPDPLAGIAVDVTAGRAAELRLELSEESLRLATEAAELGTWDLDMLTGTLTWSDRTKAMFGISAHVAVSSLDDFYGGLHPDDLAAISAAFASALDPVRRATYDVEFRTIGREDGVVRWLAARGRGLFADGRCRRAIGTAIDITARKSAALQQEFLLRLMDRLRQISDPAAITREAGTALGGFIGAHRVGYGQVRDDGRAVLLQTCYHDGVAPLDGVFQLDSFGQHNVDLHHQGVTIVMDDVTTDPFNDPAAWLAIDIGAFVSVPLVRDGGLRASLFVNRRAPHHWSPGEVTMIETVARRIWDVLERARAETALRQLNARLQGQVATRTRALDRTWRTAPVVMVVAEAGGALLDVNPAWTRILGWTAEHSIGRDAIAFTAPEDRDAARAAMALLQQGQQVTDYLLTFLTASGDRRRIAWTTVPDAGQLYSYGRDVTDQIIAEQKLQQAQKMEAVGQLTGGLAHDFNNLLTGIAGGLELLQKRVAQGRTDNLDRYIGIAQTASQRAAALTQRLLAFSRQQTLDPKPICINGLVAGMADLIRSTMGPASSLDIALAPDLHTTLVDPHQLENALLNLCINARDAMPDGGALRVRTANRVLDHQQAAEADLPAGDYVALSVEDTGTGMTPEVARRAFDPFFTTKPLGAGTGLGLSMIYGFARQSGGQVRIVSAPGQGTNVTVYLRRHDGQAGPAAPSPAAIAAGRAGRGETMLVVDDEAPIRALVREVLGELGFATIEAEHGAAALKILESSARVDFMVTDVGLPGGMNGRQLADLARRSRPDLRVLFITGYAEAAILSSGDLAPGMQVLTKPFLLETLSARIMDMIAAPAP
jgi:PAS domain S-box-containing protein